MQPLSTTNRQRRSVMGRIRAAWRHMNSDPFETANGDRTALPSEGNGAFPASTAERLAVERAYAAMKRAPVRLETLQANVPTRLMASLEHLDRTVGLNVVITADDGVRYGLRTTAEEASANLHVVAVAR